MDLSGSLVGHTSHLPLQRYSSSLYILWLLSLILRWYPSLLHIEVAFMFRFLYHEQDKHTRLIYSFRRISLSFNNFNSQVECWSLSFLSFTTLLTLLSSQFFFFLSSSIFMRLHSASSLFIWFCFDLWIFSSSCSFLLRLNSSSFNFRTLIFSFSVSWIYDLRSSASYNFSSIVIFLFYVSNMVMNAISLALSDSTLAFLRISFKWFSYRTSASSYFYLNYSCYLIFFNSFFSFAAWTFSLSLLLYSTLVNS